MTTFARAADFAPEVVNASPDFMDWPFLAGTVAGLPDRFKAPIIGRYAKQWKNQGQRAANGYLLNVQEDLTAAALDLSASDAEICEFAKDRAREVANRLADQSGTTTPEAMRAWLGEYANRHRAIVPPACKVSLQGLIGRMTDAGWWRRQIRRQMARQVEAHAIGLGFVHRRAGLYASDEAVTRHGQQQRRNRAALEQTEATNEEGYTATLAELSEVGVSNPRIRRMELMTRIAGFEDCAKAAGHVGMFYTCTAPSRMHPRFAESGQENPKYDGTPPKECAGYLSKTWAKARAWLHRRGIHIYGFRVAEPHHDGTPHWHMLFFMLPAVVESVTHCLRRYFCEADAHELKTEKAAGARFNAKRIDWNRGSAAGYISKYIAKNIDGKRNDLAAVGEDFEAAEPTNADETAPRVLAWASTWGIRQFQQIGGPGVTVWRELRRIRDMKQGDLFDTWAAADAGNWQEFTDRQGGAICARKDRPVQLWAEAVPGKTNRYSEQAAPEIHGVTLAGVHYQTRRHVWEIRRVANGSATSKQRRAGVVSASSVAVPMRGVFRPAAPYGTEGSQGGVCCDHESQRPGVLGFGFSSRVAAPWSPVNNCTDFAAPDYPAPEVWPGYENPAALIKEANRAAVLTMIESKRRRGAFGQFPRLSHA